MKERFEPFKELLKALREIKYAIGGKDNGAEEGGEEGNENDNLILGYYYKPDALLVRLSQEDYNLPIEYEIVEDVAQFIEGCNNNSYIPTAHCLYKDNTLNLLQCFASCNSGGDGASFGGAYSDEQFRKYKDTEYYYIDEYPLDE